MLKDNLKKVQTNIKSACERAGRKPEEVTLVAVSKMKPLSDIEELLETGQMEYGENYVQELCEKYENISKPVHWHMIGHLQTNKVKYIIDKVQMIHSVANYRLIDEIEKQAAKHDLVMDILLQVNIAKEESKHGFNEEEMNEVMDYLKDKPHLNPRGLMMMAPNIEVEETRQYFKATKDLLTKLQESYPNYQLTELSMGMTHDFPIAVAEGSTMVRLGHALFDE